MLPEHFGWLAFSYTASKAPFEFGVVIVNVRVIADALMLMNVLTKITNYDSYK